jgi:UDP-glucose 4-epimerase
MTIMITGGGGFLGAWISGRLIRAGHAVRVFDRSADRAVAESILGKDASRLDWHIGDVTDPDEVFSVSRDCTSIIHLAALLTPACRDNPILGAKVNLLGTLNVFEAAKRHGHSRVAYASSAGVFGPDDGRTPFPLTHYGAFKLACEGVARAYWEDSRLASVGFRPLVVYGPGREIGISAGPTLACRAAVRRQSYTIGFSGTTDMIFVDDVAAAFEATVTRPLTGAHILNLSGTVATMHTVIAEIRKHLPDADLSLDGPPLPIIPNIEKSDLTSVLGDLPHTDLPEGIARTLKHYEVSAAIG